MNRIDPRQVRHLGVDGGSHSTRVKDIRLPLDDAEASKYVREAARVYPELYFASFVILGEGSSEEIVIPKIASQMGVEIDKSFVEVVPLGGRHVNHLWRLLSGVEIPHATLLNLDRAGTGLAGGYRTSAASFFKWVSRSRSCLAKHPGIDSESSSVS